MAVYLITYDLKQPGRNYQPVYEYLKRFTHCKGMESVWLLETSKSTASILDDLKSLTDKSDVVFVTRLQRDWASLHYGCGDWLNAPARQW